MNNKIIIINGPNLNLLGEREQSQYGSDTFEQLKEKCLKKSKEIGLEVNFTQSNLEGEIVNIIQEARNCLLYTSPSPRDATLSRMPSSA